MICFFGEAHISCLKLDIFPVVVLGTDIRTAVQRGLGLKKQPVIYLESLETCLVNQLETN